MAIDGTRASLPAYGHTITRDYGRESKGGTVSTSLKDMEAAGIEVKDLYGSPALIKEMQENPEKSFNLKMTKYQDSAPVLRPLFTMGIALIGAFMGGDGMADVLDTSNKDFNKIREMLNKHGQPNDWGWGFSMHFNDYVIAEIPPKEKPPDVEKKKEQDASTVETMIVPPIPKKPPKVFESTVFFTKEDQPIAEIDSKGVNATQLKARGKAVGDLISQYKGDIVAGKPLPFKVDVLVADSTSVSESYNHGLSSSRLVSDRIKTAKATYEYLVKEKGMDPKEALSLCDKMFGLTAMAGMLKVEGGNPAEELVTKGLDAATKLGGSKYDVTVADVCMDHSNGLGTRYFSGKGVERDQAVSKRLKSSWDGTEKLLWKANEKANAAGAVKFEDTNRVASTDGSQLKTYTADRGSTLRIVEPAGVDEYEKAKADISGSGFKAWLGKLPPDKQVEGKKAAAGVLRAHRDGFAAERVMVEKHTKELVGGTNHIGEGLGKHAAKFTGGDKDYLKFDYPHEVAEMVEMVGEHNAYLLLSGKDPEKEPGLFKDLPPGVKALPERTLPDGTKTRNWLPKKVDTEKAFHGMVKSFDFKVESHGETGRLGEQLAVTKKLDAQIGEVDKEIGALTGGKPEEALSPQAAEAWFQVAQFDQIEAGFKKDSEIVGQVASGKVSYAGGAEKKLNDNLTVYKSGMATFEKWLADNPEAVKAYDAAHPGQPSLASRVEAMKKGTPPTDGSPGTMGLGSYERALVSGKSEAIAADTTINTAHNVADSTPLAKGKKTEAPQKADESKPTMAKAEALEKEAYQLASKGDVVGANKKLLEASETYRNVALAADRTTTEGKKAYDEAIAGMKGIPGKALEASQAYDKSVADKEKALPPDKKTPPYALRGRTMMFMSTGKFALESVPTLTGKPIKTEQNLQDLALDIEMKKVEVGNLKKSHPKGLAGMKEDKAKLEAEIKELEASGKDPTALKEKKGKLEKLEGTIKAIEKGDKEVADLEADYQTGLEVHGKKPSGDYNKEILNEQLKQQWVQDWVSGWTQSSAQLMQWANELLSKATGKQISLPTDMDRLVNTWAAMNTTLSDITTRNAVMNAYAHPDKVKPENIRQGHIDGALARRPADAAKYKPFKEEQDALKVETTEKLEVSGTTKEVKGTVLSDDKGVKLASFDVGGKSFTMVRGEDGKFAFMGDQPGPEERLFIEKYIDKMSNSTEPMKKVKVATEKGFGEAMAAAPPDGLVTLKGTRKVESAGGPSGEVKSEIQHDNKGLKSASFTVGDQTYTLKRGGDDKYQFVGKAPTGDHKALIEGYIKGMDASDKDREAIQKATVKAYEQAILSPAKLEPAKV